MADTLQNKMMDTKTLREKLSAWDAKTNPKAALTDKQKDSFMELTTLSANRPLPVELPLDDVTTVITRPPPVAVDDSISQHFAQSHHERLDTAQQFFLWFSEVEGEMEEEEHGHQREFLRHLHQYRGESEEVLDEVTNALSHLSDLSHRYVHVSTKTNALHEACDNSLQQQTCLVNSADHINSKLLYFNELERISAKLGSAAFVVNNESYITILSQLDDCIAYLTSNMNYKESSLYMTKLRQCLSLALGVIRSQVYNALQAATDLVQPTQQDVPSPTDDAFTLFYGKFRTNAPRVKALMEQVEARLEKSPEYEQLLSDCHTCYFRHRQSLLGPSVYSAVTDLAAKHSRDHCALVRSGSAFMVHVCEDEHQLFTHFFSKPSPALDGMLESLCVSLYDVLRPLIIHVNHLETLAELCSILKVEMLEEHVQNNPEQLGAFEVVCRQMLEDVQERLVYRTHIYIRQEILQYSPAPGDLAYPDKLHMMESIAASLRQDSQSHSLSRQTSYDGQTFTEKLLQRDDVFVTVPLTDSVSNMPMSPADLHGMWYPTVRRTLVCLSKLFRCIDHGDQSDQYDDTFKSTFQGLSQETLSMCIISLVKASSQITKNKSALDGLLFLIKHLLILREQISPFHVDFSVREMGLDFSKIKDAALGLIQARSRLFMLNTNNALLQFLLDGTPQVTETFVDSKKDVDNQLKKTCEDFIEHVCTQLVGDLDAFLTKCNTILQISQGGDSRTVSLRTQPFASPEKVHDVVAETYRNLKNRKSGVQSSMVLYLANKDTEYILFKPIKTKVQRCFQNLHSLLQEHYSAEDQQIIAAPTLEQINLLLTSGPGRPALDSRISLTPDPVRSKISPTPSKTVNGFDENSPEIAEPSLSENEQSGTNVNQSASSLQHAPSTLSQSASSLQHVPSLSQSASSLQYDPSTTSQSSSASDSQSEPSSSLTSKSFSQSHSSKQPLEISIPDYPTANESN